MFDRKKIKNNGKKKLKRNYLAAVVVCFLLAFLGCEYNSSTAIVHNYDNDRTIKENVIESTEHLTNTKIMGGKENIITNSVESFANFHSYILKLIVSTKDIITTEFKAGFVLFLIFIIQILYVFMFCNPILVGSRNFFIKNINNKANIGEILAPFKKKSFFNICLIMFKQTMYLILWIFTIVGIFIKYYEYRMIPYILAENPKLSSKEVFGLSKKIMYGNKWEMFKFDMSFFGWYILNVLTLGLVGILYSNPYKASATAEIYISLKKTTD